MRVLRISRMFALLGVVLASCNDSERSPTGPAGGPARITRQASLTAEEMVPFTYRAPLAPYMILQLPDYMVQSRMTSDIVIQRSVFAPGFGGWHTHPGPSFVYVLQGQIKLEEFSAKDGCTETPVHGVGDAYFEEGNHIHRAVVVSSESAVLLVTRFNIPVGGALSTPMTNPGC